MADRPILFSGPMVRAILEGRKTQTRRLIKPQPEPAIMDAKSRDALEACRSVGVLPSGDVPLWRWRGTFYMPWPEGIVFRCPYGKPGDRLWVRETHAWVDYLADGFEREDPVCVGYRADRTAKLFGCGRSREIDTYAWNWAHESMRWRPSIHMPRWASRLSLPVTEVRVERLQDITEEDVQAEGEHAEGHGLVAFCEGNYKRPRHAFRLLWDSINGKRAPWASNPWVWVVGFGQADA